MVSRPRASTSTAAFSVFTAVPDQKERPPWAVRRNVSVSPRRPSSGCGSGREVTPSTLKEAGVTSKAASSSPP